MSLRRDEGCIYLCFLLRPVGFCFSKILHLCHLGVTKSACPTAAEKCLSTAICPYSRWRSQPLSRVSGQQRYNTLDFAEQNRVLRWTLSPLDTLCQQGCSRHFWMTQSRKADAALLWKPPEFSASVSIQTAKSQWGYHALKIKKDRTLFHE